MRILGREISVKRLISYGLKNPAANLIHSFNYLRQKKFLDGSSSGGYALPPSTIVVETTYECNLRCKTCWFYGKSGIFKDKKISGGLSFEQLKKVVDNVAWFKPYLYFTGGEPLINKSTLPIIKYAKKKGLIVGIVTNGTLLTKENSKKLISSNLDFITVSIDGPKQTHDKIREIKCFEKAIQGINTVIIDEVHMAKADVLKRLLTGPFAHCGIRWGLTGTVPKADYEFMGLKCSIGDVSNRIQASELQDKGVLANCHVNVLQTQDHPQFKTYGEELKWLTTDKTRMKWVANTIKDISSSGNTLILVDRISAGEILEEQIDDAVFVSGSTKNTDRKEQYDEISTATNKVIIATYGVAAVGINIPRIFNLVLIEPGKSFVRVIQSIGRGIRKAEDKDSVQIWDITSSCKFAKRHLGARKKFYKEANYPYNIEKINYENPYTG